MYIKLDLGDQLNTMVQAERRTVYDSKVLLQKPKGWKADVSTMVQCWNMTDVTIINKEETVTEREAFEVNWDEWLVNKTNEHKKERE